MFSISYLLGNLKRYLLIGATLLATAGLLFLKAFRSGAKAEKNKQMEEAIKNLRARTKTDAQVDAADTSDIRERLRRDWSDK